MKISYKLVQYVLSYRVNKTKNALRTTVARPPVMTMTIPHAAKDWGGKTTESYQAMSKHKSYPAKCRLLNDSIDFGVVNNSMKLPHACQFVKSCWK